MSKKTLIMDLNNLAMRVVHINDVKFVDKETKKVEYIDWSYWRLVMFSNIYSALYQVPTHTLVLAADSKNSWRYDFWARYKEDRKKKQKEDKTEFPWKTYYQQYDQFISDIRNHFPIKILQVDKAEADDIIGILACHVDGPVEIVSTDKDFLQLCCERIKIYNPMKKTHVSHPNPKLFLAEQCLCGQSKDSIFNIKTPLDHPEGKRKPGFGPKAFEKVLEEGIDKWLTKNDLVERYKFNKVLMDFKMIPDEIKKAVINDYENYEYPDADMMWTFIEKQGWPELIENFTQMENKFLELY